MNDTNYVHNNLQGSLGYNFNSNDNLILLENDTEIDDIINLKYNLNIIGIYY